MKRLFISLALACTFGILLAGFSLWEPWTVSPTNYYLADVGPNEYRDVQFTVSNDHYYSGGGTVSISGDHPYMFSCVSGCSYYLEQGEDHIVTIRFESGSTADNYGATIEFPTNSDPILGWVGASVTLNP